MSDRAIPIDGRSYQVDGRAVARRAIPASVVDNFEGFETEPIGPYEDGEDLSTYYDGDLSYFSRNSTDPLIGEFELYGTDDNNRSIWSTSGLPNYPVQGDTFSCVMQADDPGNIQYMLFGLNANGDGYGVTSSDFNDAFRIMTFANGDRDTSLADKSALTDSTQVHELEVSWSESGEIVATSYEYDLSTETRGSQIDQLSVTDTTYNDHGIGFWTGGSDGAGPYRFDNYRIL